MNYAIVEIGGNQFKVKKDDLIQVDSFKDAAKKVVKLNKILMYHDGKKIEVGTPYLKGAYVSCEIAGKVKGKKTVAYKYKRRKSSKFKKGYRRKLLILKIQDIKSG